MAKARRAKESRMLHQKIDVHETTVENPLWMRQHDGETSNVRFIKAAINARESSITTLYVRKLILPHQKEAADRFRLYYETMGGAGASAIDYTKEHVDGGRIPEPIRIAHLEAGKKLKQAHTMLGEYGYRMVGLIAGEGRSVKELSADRRSGDTLMDNLRRWLDELAATWGLSTRPGVLGRNYRAKR